MEPNEQTVKEIYAAPTPKEPWYKKYALPIIIGMGVIFLGYLIWNGHTKPTTNPTIIKRDTIALRFLVNDLGGIAQGVGFKDKLSDGGYVYEVITGVDTLKGQMDTVQFQRGHYLMDTVKDVLNQPVMDTVFNGRQIVMDSASKKPKLTARLKYRLVPSVRPHFEFRNPKNVEELPSISIHLLPPHPSDHPHKPTQ
jgi:hypothetical protein